ncbi:heterokaryon incompatibility protein-domain-containing protein [Pyrenochaeta sp. MPI-SDFR-AT-0127]|nr:heterokaryon incompatibility protein-domain-containing protein [Pyrenochaeta sp. MPI-SDFR-AT-0127]
MASFRHLRDVTNDMVLWVDAVCINQMDTAEKSQQVALMGQIYRQCSQVRIWLGCNVSKCGLFAPIRRVDSMMDEPAKQQDPFNLIRHLAEDRHIYEWPCFKVLSQEKKVQFEENKIFNDLWEGFVTVAQSAWWSRMWTVQEVILPKAGVLTFDTWSTPLEDITKCGAGYYNHVWGCCQHAVAILPQPIGLPLDEFCTSFYTLHGDRNNLAEDEYFDMQDQHLSYGHRQCQDPRDKVYGLLSLIGDISDLDVWLTPNYSSTHNEVFYDATCAMLHRSLRDFKCLTGAEYGPGASKWASWVRDFEAPFTQTDADINSNRLMIYNLFDASSGSKGSYEHYMTWPQLADEKPHQVALGVTGKCVGTVKSISEHIKEGDPNEYLVQKRHSFEKWMRASSMIDLDEYDGSQPQSRGVEKFWRTILGGVASTGDVQASDWRRFTSEDMTWLNQFLSWVKNGEPDLDFALDRTILIATHGRCYFQTQNKGQGLCYPKTQIGDEVWVINGSKVPFILRKLQLGVDELAELNPSSTYGVSVDGVYGVIQDSEPRPKKLDACYEFIGDCYFDGFMDGEGVYDTSLPNTFILLL